MINLEKHDHNMINTRPIATESLKISILTTYDDCQQVVSFDSITLLGESHYMGNLNFFLKLFFLLGRY